MKKKKIFAIIGSASTNSANLGLVKNIAIATEAHFSFSIFDRLNELPHFNPALSIANTPQNILDLRNEIENADGILICTPEYIFSIPSGLKNLIEWCVSTTVFSGKPLAIITASSSGKAGHDELKMIMRTVEAIFTEETCLLIQGVKAKIDAQGNIMHEETKNQLNDLSDAFRKLIDNNPQI